MRPILAGAVAGTLATLPMTFVMLRLFRRLPREQQYHLPPREITQELARRAGLEPALSERQLAATSMAAHFAYGAATGAPYPLLARPGTAKVALVSGSIWGLLIWALSYLGWIPAARILRPATEHPRQRVAMMLAAHVVWGAATGWLSGLLTRRRPR